MSFRDYAKKRLVDAIVNKTDYEFGMYEQGTGKVIEAIPDKLPFPEYYPDSKFYPDGKVLCLIVTPEKLEQIKVDFPNRPLDDVGVLVNPPVAGNSGRLIGRIFWAKDLTAEVVFYPNATSVMFPHL